MRLTAAALAAALLLLAACQKPEATVPQQPPVATGNAQRGVMLAGQYGCNNCHQVPGVDGPQGALAPSLAKLGSQGTIAVGTVPVTADVIERYIQNPQSVNPQSAMPAVPMPEADAHDIAAYLLTLK
jgi:cytochrome c1